MFVDNKISVFGPFTIVNNVDIANMATHIRRIAPSYIPDMTWPGNKTLIYNLRQTGECVIPINILMKEAVVIVPIGSDFISIITPLLEYLKATIKSICPYNVANEIGFRLTIYMPPSHKDNLNIGSNQFVKNFSETFHKGILDETLGMGMKRYEIGFRFNADWSMVPIPKPCFSPPPTTMPLHPSFSGWGSNK
jgi:hypothetical protein